MVRWARPSPIMGSAFARPARRHCDRMHHACGLPHRYLKREVTFRSQDPNTMKTYKARSLVLLSAVMLTIGGSFKLMHWPTANIQLALGALVLVIAFLVLAINVARRRGIR